MCYCYAGQRAYNHGVFLLQSLVGHSCLARMTRTYVLTLFIIGALFAGYFWPDKPVSWTFGKQGKTGKWISIHSEKWIVVTTIAYPTSDIKFLANIPGWKVVVAGDTRTPDDWHHPNCVFLSIDDQESLGFETNRFLPEHSYSRKNAAYLFAIAHGANVVYETDDDNRPLDLLNNFILTQNLSGLLYNGTHLFNSYHHFGQSTLWPRGYPLSSIGENMTSNYILGQWKTPSIQQGIVNGDPDMDAIFRLTRMKTDSVLNVNFDGNCPLAVIPAGVFSPFNSQNTLFRYDALWALLIPTTPTFRVCDIWRGYWAQRLLWEIGDNLGFFSPNAFQKRNSHSYYLDAVEEKDLYFKTERLVKLLTDWVCQTKYSFFECVIKLSQRMVEEHIWKVNDAKLTSAWITDLRAIGYKEPRRITSKTHLRGVDGVTVVLPSQSPDNNQIHRVRFSAAEQLPPFKAVQQKQEHILNQFSRITSYCKHLNITINNSPAALRQFPDVLLIVVFNYPHYSNVPFLDTIYSTRFLHILYCGSNKESFEINTQNFRRLSFVEVNVNNGFLSQKCLISALKMGYGVEGYLYIADDTLLNFWNLPNLPFEKLWLSSPMILQQSRKSTWYWFNILEYGLKAYTNSLMGAKRLDEIRFKNFFKLLARNTGKSDGFYHALSDIAYVPKRLQSDVLYFLEHFSIFNVFVEITFPTVFYGIAKKEDIHSLKGSYLWGKDRREYQSYFNKDHIFLHPLKLSRALATQQGKQFYCSEYIPLILR